MLAKKYKLPIQEYIGKKEARKEKARHFSVRQFISATAWSRFGVVVGKKIAARATARNEIRRAVFRIVAEMREALPVADYLLTAHSGAATLTREAQEKEIRQLLTSLL